jgi:hypothetical protein
LRNGIGLSQEHAQVWAQKADYWVHKKVIDLTCAAAAKGVWQAAVCGIGAISIDYRETYRAARYYYFSSEGIKETLSGLIWDNIKSKLGHCLKWKEKYPDLEFIWEK